MRNIICNILNLDANSDVRGLQSIVRTNSSGVLVSVARGVVRFVGCIGAPFMRQAAAAMAKPAYAMVPGSTRLKKTAGTRMTAMTAISEPMCSQHARPWQVGLLSLVDTGLGRVGRG